MDRWEGTRCQLKIIFTKIHQTPRKTGHQATKTNNNRKINPCQMWFDLINLLHFRSRLVSTHSLARLSPEMAKSSTTTQPKWMAMQLLDRFRVKTPSIASIRWQVMTNMFRPYNCAWVRHRIGTAHIITDLAKARIHVHLFIHTVQDNYCRRRSSFGGAGQAKLQWPRFQISPRVGCFQDEGFNWWVQQRPPGNCIFQTSHASHHYPTLADSHRRTRIRQLVVSARVSGMPVLACLCCIFIHFAACPLLRQRVGALITCGQTLRWSRIWFPQSYCERMDQLFWPRYPYLDEIF